MEQYPFYRKFISLIKLNFRLISRIRAIINAPNTEVCEKNKILSIKMLLIAYDEDIKETENTVLEQEFNFCEVDILECQEKISALAFHFTLFLN